MQRRDFIRTLAVLTPGALLAGSVRAAPRRWLNRSAELGAARRLAAQTAAAASNDPSARHCVGAAQAQLWLGLLATRHGATGVQSHYEEGQTWAERAQRADPKDAGGYFFEAVHRAKIGELRGAVASVVELPRLQTLMDRTDGLAPGYGYCGTARFWGAVIAKTPSFLLRLKGSSLDAGDAHFRRAMVAHPDFAGNHVLRAPLLARLFDDAAAKKSLVAARDMRRAKDPGVEAWNRYYRSAAHRALQGA